MSTTLSERGPGMRVGAPGSKGDAVAPSRRRMDHGNDGTPPPRSLSLEFAETLLAWSQELETRNVTLAEFMWERG